MVRRVIRVRGVLAGRRPPDRRGIAAGDPAVLPRPAPGSPQGATSNACGVVAVTEPGRALEPDDMAAVLGLSVITTIPVRGDLARAVDPGVLAARLPEPLASAASQILRFSLPDVAREVA